MTWRDGSGKVGTLMQETGTDTERTTGESSRGSHMIGTLARCPRAYGYKYLLGLDPVRKSKPLSRGTLMHEALEELYRGGDWMGAVVNASEENAAAAPDVVEIMRKYVERFDVRPREDGTMVETYHGVTSEVVFVEKEFDLDIGGETMTRRLDLGLRLPNTSLMIVDHKTAGRPSERMNRSDLEVPLFTQAAIGPQVAKRLGMPWGSAQVSLIGTGQAKGTFSREELWYSKEFLARALESLRYWLELEGGLRRAWREGNVDPWSLAMTFNCYPNGYACDYRPLCRDGDVALRWYRAEQ